MPKCHIRRKPPPDIFWVVDQWGSQSCQRKFALIPHAKNLLCVCQRHRVPLLCGPLSVWGKRRVARFEAWAGWRTPKLFASVLTQVCHVGPDSNRKFSRCLWDVVFVTLVCLYGETVAVMLPDMMESG